MLSQTTSTSIHTGYSFLTWPQPQEGTHHQIPSEEHVCKNTGAVHTYRYARVFSILMIPLYGSFCQFNARHIRNERSSYHIDRYLVWRPKYDTRTRSQKTPLKITESFIRDDWNDVSIPFHLTSKVIPRFSLLFNQNTRSQSYSAIINNTTRHTLK